jgi:hypothetical protein
MVMGGFYPWTICTFQRWVDGSTTGLRTLWEGQYVGDHMIFYCPTWTREDVYGSWQTPVFQTITMPGVNAPVAPGVPEPTGDPNSEIPASSIFGGTGG